VKLDKEREAHKELMAEMGELDPMDPMDPMEPGAGPGLGR
jgi:hypothetical protein